MKKLIIVLFLMVWIHSLFAQQLIPQFVMPLWFEDAVGNKDTIWVGGDPRSSYTDIQPLFGEISITEPFDSVFEVRAVHGFDQFWRTSKRIIEDNEEPNDCPLFAHTRIMIQAKYKPITISWDTVILRQNYPCNVNAILTHGLVPRLIENWYEAPSYHCLNPVSSIVSYMDYGDIFDTSHKLLHPFEIEGGTVDTVFGYWISGFWDVDHCTPVIDNTSAVPLLTSVRLFPNPTQGASITVSWNQNLTIQGQLIVYNSMGQKFATYTIPKGADSYTIPTESLQSASYFIQARSEKGEPLFLSSFVKQ